MSVAELLTLGVFALILLSVPIGFAIVAASAALLIWLDGPSLMVVPQRVFGGIDSFALLAIPFFLLTGNLMSAGGMTGRLLDFANSVLGRFRGGLAMSGILASTLFAGISGSAVADTSALGRILIPAMKKAGYRADFAVASIAAANVVAPIIPPSIAFIVLGVLTNQSITQLFLAGLVPGMLYGVSMLLLAWWIARRRDYPVSAVAEKGAIWRAFKAAAFALLLPIFILFGIRTGVFNVTECSAVAVVYSVVVGTLIHRELTLAKFIDALRQTARMTAVILIIVGAARVFSWILAYYNVPTEVAAFVSEHISHPLVFLLMVNIILLVVGMFLEANAAIVMLVPVLFPIAASLGIDPLHFSVVMVLNLCIGLITPPVGLCLNIAAVIGRLSLERAALGVLPFLGVAFGVLLLITLIPSLVTFIPSLLGGR